MITGKVTALNEIKEGVSSDGKPWKLWKMEFLENGKQYAFKCSSFENPTEYLGGSEITVELQEKDSGKPNPHNTSKNIIYRTIVLPNKGINQPSQPQATTPAMQSSKPNNPGSAPADLITKIRALTKKVDELEKQIIELQTGQRPQGAVQTVLPPDHEEQGEPDPTIPF
jgi:hypothetical protein